MTAEKTAQVVETSGPPVQLPTFSGPLDLLLHLIQKNEVSVYDIPIASICDQFHAHLAAMQEIDLQVAGEFLWMAAWLLQLKSKMLLPRTVGDQEDPRAELVERLLEYRRVKEVAGILSEIHVVRRCVWPTGVGLDLADAAVELDWEDVDLDLISRTYLDVMQRFADAHPPPLTVLPLRFTVEQKIRELYGRVRAEGLVPLMRDLRTRSETEEVVTVVVAVLELARLGGVHAEQRRPFAEIYLRPGSADIDLDNLRVLAIDERT